LEILVPHICGGSKIMQIQKIQKMLFSFELPLSTFKRFQMLWNELFETWAGQLAIISGGFGPQCMIEDLLIAQYTLHVGGDPALSYTILVESTKQLGLLGHVDRFAGANLRGKTSGFWLEVQVCTFSIINCSHDQSHYVHIYFCCH
jgi:hypothetical protein